MSAHTSGWKPIPLPLKIICVLSVLWALGAVANLSNLMNYGVPFFGMLLKGTSALPVPLVLDFLGPIGLIFASLKRLPWGPKWATFYMGAFIVNAAFTLIFASDLFSVPQILAPALVSVALLLVVYWKRGYYASAP